MRSQVDGGLLRGCPTCGTKVDAAELGMRDFRWVNEVLPGKVGGMDIDFVINQAATGRGLHLEMKPRGARISQGARLTMRMYVRLGLDAWAVWDNFDGTVDKGAFDGSGRVRNVVTMTQAELAQDVLRWWDEGFEEASD